MPDPCSESPPEEPNNFSDGTLKNPQIQFLGFGAFGTWHPGRDVSKEPLHEFEVRFGTCSIEGKGVAVCGPMQGQRGSSTRGELGAGIMGLYAPRAIHQASDSMAYVRKANEILDGRFHRRRKAKPWQLQKDGDLWEHFEKAVAAKGRNAIRISWTKGHATSKHVDAGITTAQKKEGNEKADEIADRGCKLGMQELAGFWASQRQELKELMLRIQRAILRVLKAEQKERNEAEAQKMLEQRALHGSNAGKIRIPSSFPFAMAPAAAAGSRVEISRPKASEINDQDRRRVFVAFHFHSQLLLGADQRDVEWFIMVGTFCSVLH
jgi:ribonuclease HI